MLARSWFSLQTLRGVAIALMPVGDDASRQARGGDPADMRASSGKKKKKR
jgi:hypothetical protein